MDPTKEVEAYKQAIKAGLTTRTDVISKTADGRDIEYMDEERVQELEAAKAKGLVFDTDPEVTKAEIEAKKQPPAPKDNGEDLKKLGDKQEAAEKENGDRFRSLERLIHRTHADQMRAVAEKQMVLNLGDTIVNNQQTPVSVDARSTVTVPERQVTVENRNDIVLPERPKRAKKTGGAVQAQNA